MRSPITGLVNQFHELTIEEQKVFLDLVDPQPEQEVQKQTRKKRGPSKRAASLSAAIKSATTFCARADCGLNESSAIHDPNGGYAGYHPFVSVAQPVAKKSSRKSAGTSSTPSIEGATENALAASSAGD